MDEIKMTNVLIATSQFLVTCAFPVKIKTEQAVSKHKTIVKESIDAVIEITSIAHAFPRGSSLAKQLFALLTQSSPMEHTKRKQAAHMHFLEACGVRVRNEIDESLQVHALDAWQDNVESIIINLLDKDGAVLQSKKQDVAGVIHILNHLDHTVSFWPQPKTAAQSLITERELPHPVSTKSRRKERGIKSEKEENEGGIRRHFNYNVRKVA